MENQQARGQIISGIAADAGKQAEEMLAEAKSAAEERMRSAQGQADRFATEEEKKASERIAAIERESAIRLAAAKRRIGLEMRESVYQEVVDRCTAAFANLIGDDRYDDILLGWIVEAAAGLQSEAARVTCSEKETAAVVRILTSAKASFKTASGLPVEIAPAKGSPLSRQGIELTAMDGKTAYNNQVHSRLARYKTEIRKLVHQQLFQDE